jgi:hypothetical protein
LLCLGLPSGLLPSGFPTETLDAPEDVHFGVIKSSDTSTGFEVLIISEFEGTN